ncbi:MAG: DNA methyltransferase [Promethearchaeati archaeon SRVP18_Atabeyarchaeia-1]
MKEVSHKDYLEFIKERGTGVIIGDQQVELRQEWRIESYAPPDDYKPEKETVWSFPNRGNWATHVGDYRGNWSPYIPRNLIMRYTKPGDHVLDQMAGSGTTLVECKLLWRNGVGVDINPNAVMVARDRLNFEYASSSEQGKSCVIRTYVGDARYLNEIASESVDLVATHPPYARMIMYTRKSAGALDGDLSWLPLQTYLREMSRVAEESLRVLKPSKHCAILIGDTRKQLHYVPIAFRVMQAFLDAGFILREDIIKRQWKMKGTRERWRGKGYDFYLITHEHVFVFRKPASEEELSRFRHSSRNMFRMETREDK